MSLADTLRILFRRATDAAERAVDNANGDVIEALHGHVCDADCWHNAWVPGQPAAWLSSPDDEQVHAFSAKILEQPGRKRYYSACGRVFLREPPGVYAPRRCPDCVRIVDAK